MNCQDFEPAIDDYVDGPIGQIGQGEGRFGGVAVEALQGHLATCARCAALEADLRAIRAAARALPAHEPAPHVWTSIAAAAAAERGGDGSGPRVLAGVRTGVLAGSTSWRRAWQPIAAAAMAVLVTATLAVVGTRLEPLKQAPGRAAVQARASDPAEVAAAVDAVQETEGEYIQAINGLEAITSTASDTLDQETADVLQANLTVVDQAIGESRAAIKEEPESQLAIASLFDALRRKLSLLQDMVALINEMRQGNAEGAARIASGLNQ
jgi:hypothetical protein